MTGFRDPNRYSAPYKGRLRYLDITDQSLERIVEVVAEYFGCFDEAAALLEKQGHLE